MPICCMNPGQLPEHKEHHVKEGWFDIIDKLHKELVKVCPEYSVMQVKEKFGGLRAYITGNEEAFELELKYENLSFTVCEICGQPGKLRRSRAWMKTLCDEHELSRNK